MRAEFWEVALDVAVMVPSAGGDLDEADAGLAEFAGEETGASERAGVFSIDAVEVEGGLGFVGDVHDVRGGELHEIGRAHV